MRQYLQTKYALRVLSVNIKNNKADSYTKKCNWKVI